LHLPVSVKGRHNSVLYLVTHTCECVLGFVVVCILIGSCFGGVGCCCCCAMISVIGTRGDEREDVDDPDDDE